MTSSKIPDEPYHKKGADALDTIPFDDALRRILKSPPKHKKGSDRGEPKRPTKPGASSQNK